MKKLIAAATAAVLLFSLTAYAWTPEHDAGYAGRREWALAAQANMGATPNSARSYVQKALAMLWLGQDTAYANELLASDMVKNSGFNDSPFYLYWTLPAMVRIYRSFNRTDGLVAPLLEPEAEEVLLTRMWDFVSEFSDNALTDSDPNRIVYSENHNMHMKSSMLLICQILEQKYPERTVCGGISLETFQQQLTDYLKNYLRQHADYAPLIEGGASYVTMTLEGIYTLRDLAEDTELRRLCDLYLDWFWLDYALVSAGGIRGNAKAREYADWAATGRSWISGLSSVYFGHANASDQGTIANLLVAGYYPPAIAVRLMNEPQLRGSYEYYQRKLGLGTHTTEPCGNEDVPVYHLSQTDGVTDSTPAYTYVTPHFAMGSFLRDGVRPLTAIDSQNNWEGVVFDADADARVYVQIDSTNNSHNNFTSMQKGPVLITRKNDDVPTGIYLHIFGETYADGWTAANGTWLSGQMGDAYWGVRPLVGGVTKRDGKLYVDDPSSPIVIRAGTAEEFSTLSEFNAALEAMSCRYENNTVTVSAGGWGTLSLGLTAPFTRLVNGQPIHVGDDLSAHCPYVTGVRGEPIRASFGGDTLVLDFDAVQKTVNGTPYYGADGVDVPPVASDVTISGDNFALGGLTADYQYTSPLGLPEGETLVHWYYAREEDGPYQRLPGTGTAFTPSPYYRDGYIRAGVTPVSSDNKAGEMVYSPPRRIVTRTTDLVRDRLDSAGDAWRFQTTGTGAGYTCRSGILTVNVPNTSAAIECMRNIETVSRTCVATFRFRNEGSSANVVYLKGSGGAAVTFNASGSLTATVGDGNGGTRKVTLVGSLDDTLYYELGAVLHFDTHTVDIFLDGRCIGMGYPMRQNADNLSQFYTQRGGAGTTYIDELAVYEAVGAFPVLYAQDGQIHCRMPVMPGENVGQVFLAAYGEEDTLEQLAAAQPQALDGYTLYTASLPVSAARYAAYVWTDDNAPLLPVSWYVPE